MNLNSFDYEASYGTSAQLKPSDMPEIAFAGRSNVGKSSLLNKVLNRKSLARVSSMPGKTVTINFFKGNGLRLVDLPGYGYAKVSRAEKERWAELMEGYFKSGRNIKLVVQLVDMRHKPTADDLTMVNFLNDAGYPFIIVMTKSDKLNKSEYKAQVEAMTREFEKFGDLRLIPFSSLNGEGTEEIRTIIDQYANN
ncbi:MAG: ribosome biogenesis GTP-binding protein YihA/YsxC [Clostridiales bacterium]|nr:ribosome biogenesis GTP-binding protein YihA/YsxC [Clostridiales bacterium]